MRPILIVLLLASPCAAADWGFMRDAVAAAPPVTIAKPACACGDSCQCAGELVELRAYRDKMEAYLTRYAGHTLPYRTVSTTSVVQQTSPVVTYTYADDPVCVDGQCYAPSRGGYTNGYYTNWMQPYSTGTRRSLFRGKVIRSGFGGNCVGGNCQ